eukprot:CAMPEP_0202859386 /NCGR_PEP_ID=MMETSP1391-20130828/1522_1 /ASSEMBLY_ACC=CAM_ASM_000867 /TAXON_ID=1034604 /ORGANISM="Chlamydomonas leiostraca, Strain SAG 11-49" /LENGTH=457 /DNA_ID=CAMNT_0049538415 /DNA_START=116 /DNA_END=1486 /DNA_ORIENTATION=-
MHDREGEVRPEDTLGIVRLIKVLLDMQKEHHWPQLCISDHDGHDADRHMVPAIALRWYRLHVGKYPFITADGVLAKVRAYVRRPANARALRRLFPDVLASPLTAAEAAWGKRVLDLYAAEEAVGGVGRRVMIPHDGFDAWLDAEGVRLYAEDSSSSSSSSAGGSESSSGGGSSSSSHGHTTSSAAPSPLHITGSGTIMVGLSPATEARVRAADAAKAGARTAEATIFIDHSPEERAAAHSGLPPLPPGLNPRLATSPFAAAAAQSGAAQRLSPSFAAAAEPLARAHSAQPPAARAGHASSGGGSFSQSGASGLAAAGSMPSAGHVRWSETGAANMQLLTAVVHTETGGFNNALTAEAAQAALEPSLAGRTNRAYAEKAAQAQAALTASGSSALVGWVLSQTVKPSLSHARALEVVRCVIENRPAKAARASGRNSPNPAAPSQTVGAAAAMPAAPPGA